MHDKYFEKIDCDSPSTRKLIDSLIKNGDLFKNTRKLLYDAIDLNISKKEIFNILQQDRIDYTERFIVENAIIKKRLDVDDYLLIHEKEWKKRIDTKALLVIIKELVKKKISEYRDFLSIYTKRSHIASEALSLYNILPIIQTQNYSAAKTIAIISNCNMEYLAKLLELSLFSSDLETVVWNCDFDQWATQLYEDSSKLYQISPSLLIVYLSSLGLTRAGSRFCLDAFNHLATGLERYIAKTQGDILLVMPEPLEEEYFSDSPAYRWRKQWFKKLQQWIKDSSQHERLTVCDLEPLIQDVGRQEWYAARYWYHAKLPCHLNTLLPFGRYLLKYIRRLMLQSIKVIVCDLDNTLWGGVVGEVGWQNVDLDPNGSGGAFIRLQASLKHAKNNGILLAITSKNDETHVREVFSKRSEMLLTWEDFTLIKVNWSPKPDNIKDISKQLNLSLQHFCFLDDSPFERSSVRENLPEVHVPDLPNSPDQYVPYLIKTGLFFFPRTTEVDRQRPALYKAEMSRATARKMSTDYASFLTGLSMKLYPYDISNENIGRCEQLLMRTNQFNVTGLRLSQAELGIYVQDKSVFSKCYRMIDRFGDSGIIGLIIAVKEHPEAYRIISWVLSCRVMGRYVEHSMMAHLTACLDKFDIKLINSKYVPTTKNRTIADILPSLGFTTMNISQDDLTVDFQLQLHDRSQWQGPVDIIE